MDKELERLEKLKKNSIENPGKKKRGCTDCKKKKEIVQPLPPVIYEDIWIPTKEEIILAFEELTSYGGVREDKKIFINKVYNYIFNEGFDWACRDCVNKQARKFNNYVSKL